MPIDIRPATVFDDVAAVIGPKRPDANVCWCLSYRLGSKQNQQLHGLERGERVRELVADDPPPGVRRRSRATRSTTGARRST
ncbi:hypothetical protein ACQB6R_01445 [Propionibacteriaceae bacterium G1746]|uniref:hypothetical protein n=1 Tax=Aestuariimicrobium sp. G57 TaxID=3418485 RepID=UPI003C1A87C0